MPKFCNKCGFPLDISKKFCPHCGILLKKTDNNFNLLQYNLHKRKIIYVSIFMTVMICMVTIIYLTQSIKSGDEKNLSQLDPKVSKILRLGMTENNINNIQLVSRRSSGECVFICNKINELDMSNIIPNINICENEMIFLEGKGLVSIELKFDINNYQQVKNFLVDKYGKSKCEKWTWGKGTYESMSDEWDNNIIIRLFRTKNIKDSKVKDEVRIVIMEKEYFYRKNKI